MGLINIGEEYTIKLKTINDSSVINIASTSENRDIEHIRTDSTEFENNDIFDISNIGPVKIFKLTKFKNVVCMKKLKIEFLIP